MAIGSPGLLVSQSPCLSRLCALCVLCGEFFVFAAATAAPLVMPVEGERFAAELVSVDTQGQVAFRPTDPPREADSPRTLQLEELVRWGHPQPPRPQPLVLLANGSRLVAAAAWAGGAPVQLVGDELVVKSDLLDDVRLSGRLVRGIVFAERSHPRERRRLEERVRAAQSTTDEVLLTNNDRLAGKMIELQGGTLTLSTAAGEAKLPLSRVEAVVFADPQAEGRPWQNEVRPLRPAASGIVLVGLRDGSLLYATSIRAGESVLELQLSGGDVRLTGGAAGDVTALQSLGSERFTYLSDVTPAGYRHVPYLSIEWPYRRDRNVRGEPLSAGGERYGKGLGMHSAARLTYRLDGRWRQFEAAAAMDDSAARGGSVTFGVYLLRDGQWREAYTSPIVRGGDPPVDLSVDVTGAEGITLTVDYADRGDELDHADWLDARLVK